MSETLAFEKLSNYPDTLDYIEMVRCLRKVALRTPVCMPPTRRKTVIDAYRHLIKWVDGYIERWQAEYPPSDARKRAEGRMDDRMFALDSDTHEHMNKIVQSYKAYINVHKWYVTHFPERKVPYRNTDYERMQLRLRMLHHTMSRGEMRVALGRHPLLDTAQAVLVDTGAIVTSFNLQSLYDKFGLSAPDHVREAVKEAVGKWGKASKEDGDG